MNTKQKWQVHKFGGTSVQTAERIRSVAKIIQDIQKKSPDIRLAVVVSAMKGVTDALIDLVQLAIKDEKNVISSLQALKARHLQALDELKISKLSLSIEKSFKNLEETLKVISSAGSASEKTIEFISGHGEVWSAQIIAAYIESLGHPTRYVDAREVVVVDDLEPMAPAGKSRVVQWEVSSKKLAEWLKKSEALYPPKMNETYLITGFIASTSDGVPTTLRRNGSDYTGAIFGKLLNASEIVIWTDVDGVLSADPRLVPDAVVLQEMSYNEMTELANFGAKVVHPATMGPAIRNNIPIWIRNTFNPNFPGTKIHSGARSQGTVKGFSAIEKMALINIEGSGLVGVTGVAERLFGALRLARISVVMISQASSEHSICIAVSEVESNQAKVAIEKAFFSEIQDGSLDQIVILKGKSVLAAVGDNMVERPGVAGQFFSALGRAGVSIDAIAQGSSERNISAVINGQQTSLALRVVHSSFYLAPLTINVGIIGLGTVGKEFLKQLKGQLSILKERFDIHVRVRGVANSKVMILDSADESGIDPKEWPVECFKSNTATDLDLFAAHVRSKYLPHSVIIDATANSEIAKKYASWFQSGLHVIAANKNANSTSYQEYGELRKKAKTSERQFLYSTNVGAGLPILKTIRDLYQTGDHFEKVEGVLSGTLSFLFNSYDGKTPFSEQIKIARALGYTEPDPRQDLSGLDVARKLVIISREAGVPLDLKDVAVENLVPEALRVLPFSEYLLRMNEGDAEMKARFLKAQSNGEVLRYVGCIDEKGKASVALKSYSVDHPMARLGGSDNMVTLQTSRYHSRPLVIQGPGAGPSVTAAGIFADLLHLVFSVGGCK